MAVHAAAAHPTGSRSGAPVDPTRQAEFPIVLGDALKGRGKDQATFINIRYNWKPKHLHAKQKTTITQDSAAADSSSYQLLIQNDSADGKPYKYHGKLAADSVASSSAGPSGGPSFALVYDASKPAFRLEPVTSALNFNLVSGPGQNQAAIHKHPLISLDPKNEHIQELGTVLAEEENLTAEDSVEEDDEADQEPDKDNTYDFRHFLKEAKAAAEAGQATPRPGSMSGMASPIPGASRLLTPSRPGTPLNRPMAAAASNDVVKKRKASDESSKRAAGTSAPRSHGKASSTTQKKKPTPINRKGVKTVPSSTPKPKPALSADKISGSDSAEGEESNMSDTITLPPPPSSRNSKPHKHNLSETRAYASSPHIVVDEASDLIIEFGSPPPSAASRQNKKIQINPDAFAGGKSNAGSNVASPAPGGTDLDADGESDIDMLEDGDVEDLVLPSPRAARGGAGGSSSMSTISRVEAGPPPSSSRGLPPAPLPESMDEDEDDELAAELEAALEEGEGEDDDMVGLGISRMGQGGAGGSGMMVDDESEVSEEE